MCVLVLGQGGGMILQEPFTEQPFDISAKFNGVVLQHYMYRILHHHISRDVHPLLLACLGACCSCWHTWEPAVSMASLHVCIERGALHRKQHQIASPDTS